jgi:hypothetical protein
MEMTVELNVEQGAAKKDPKPRLQARSVEVRIDPTQSQESEDIYELGKASKWSEWDPQMRWVPLPLPQDFEWSILNEVSGS